MDHGMDHGMNHGLVHGLVHLLDFVAALDWHHEAADLGGNGLRTVRGWLNPS